MKKHLVACLAMLVLSVPQFAAANDTATMTAPLCGQCHKAEANVIRGTLSGVSNRRHILRFAMNGQEVTVRYTAATPVRNLTSLQKLDQYLGKSFRVFYVNNEEGRQAIQITRFAPLGLLAPSQILSTAELERLLRQPSAPFLIDIRPVAAFRAGHIPGALNVPWTDLLKASSRLPAAHAAELVIYGSGGTEDAKAAIALLGSGFRQVHLYRPGFAAWDRDHVTACSLNYARKQHALGARLISLRAKPAYSHPTNLACDLQMPLADLAGSRDRLPTNQQELIVVYGPGQETGAVTLKAMGYRQVRILNPGLPALAERLKVKRPEKCY